MKPFLNKKITLTTALLLLISFAGMSQIKINSADVEIILPKEVVKDPNPLPITQNSDGTIALPLPKGEYQFGNHNFSLRHSEITKNPNLLIDVKRGMDNLKRRYDPEAIDYKTTIAKFNGYDTLISSGSGNYIVFYLVNQDYTYVVSGMLHYEGDDKARAKKHVYKILKGVRMNAH